MDTNFKTPEDKRMYQRDYQRLRYQNDPNFRQKIINNSARTRLKKQLSKPKDIIMECVLNKIQQGPNQIHIVFIPPKKEDDHLKLMKMVSDFLNHINLPSCKH